MIVGHSYDNFKGWSGDCLNIIWLGKYNFPVKFKTETLGLGKLAQGKQELILPKTLAWHSLAFWTGYCFWEAGDFLKSSYCSYSIANQRISRMVLLASDHLKVGGTSS